MGIGKAHALTGWINGADTSTPCRMLEGRTWGVGGDLKDAQPICEVPRCLNVDAERGARAAALVVATFCFCCCLDWIISVDVGCIQYGGGDLHFEECCGGKSFIRSSGGALLRGSSWFCKASLESGPASPVTYGFFEAVGNTVWLTDASAVWQCASLEWIWTVRYVDMLGKTCRCNGDIPHETAYQSRRRRHCVATVKTPKACVVSATDLAKRLTSTQPRHIRVGLSTTDRQMTP